MPRRACHDRQLFCQELAGKLCSKIIIHSGTIEIQNGIANVEYLATTAAIGPNA